MSDSLDIQNEPKSQSKASSLSTRIKQIMKTVTKTQSLRPIMNFIKIFRVVISEENSDGVVIEDSEVFSEVMKFALTKLPVILRDILALPEDLKGFKVKNKKMEIILKVFLSNLYKFLSKLHDEEMIIFLLKFLPNLAELIIITNNILKGKYIRHFIDLWSTNDSVIVKLNSFVILRKIATLSSDDLEPILKRTYAAFVKRSKNMNWRTYELITFMMNCYKELLGINFKVSYLVAFNFINQMAQLLKKFYKEKNPSNIHTIYNWQFIHSLKLWLRSVIDHESELGELIFPLIYLSQGVMELYPAPKYFPLSIQIIAELNNAARKMGINIPCTKTILFSLLNSKEFTAKKSNKKPKAFDFDINIKVSKEYSQTNAFWNSLFNEILDLLVDYLGLSSRKIDFPEISNFLVLNLKKLQKKYTFNYYKMKIKLLLQKIQECRNEVEQSRKNFGKPITSLKECQEFESSKAKSTLETEYEKIKEEKENLRKQKILAEKEGQSESEEETEGENEGDIAEEGNEDDLQKPLSEEEDLDLE